MLKKVSSSSGNSGITKALEKELEHLTKTGSPMKYSIVRGDDVADLKAAYQKIVDGKLSKSDAIKIAIEKKLVEDDDDITAKKAIDAIKKAVSKPEKETKKAVNVKTDDLDLSKKEDRLKFAERKKAQYNNDAYTGNGTAQPSQFNDPTETNAENPRERYLVPGKQKDVQMKSDITPGEQMDPVAPVASTDADKDIAFLEAKLEAAKKRKVEEDMKKVEALKSMLSSLSPELRDTLKAVLSNEPEKKTELKVEALDAPALPEEIVKTPVQEKETPMEINVNLGGGKSPSANPTMSQDLQNPNTSNPTMGQGIAASKKIEAAPVVEVKSILREIVDAIKGMTDVEEAKKYVINYLSAKEIDEDNKRKMIQTVQNEDTLAGLLTYLYNALLAYEGMRMRPIRSVMASKETVDEIIKLLSRAKDIEDLLKAEVMLQDGIIPVEHIDRAIEIWTLDKDKAKTHIDEQLKLLKDSLKLKAKFVHDKEKKSDSYWLVKSTKNEPIFKVTASQAFGAQIVANWDMFKSDEYKKTLEKELESHGVLKTIENFYPEATIFDEGLKNIMSSRQKVVAQIPTQTDMAVGEPNTEPMDLKEDGANVVVENDEELQKQKGAPALVSKETSDELLAPTEKQPHISDLLVEILAPMIVGSEVNTPESIIQDLKALLTDDDSSSIFLGKVKQKVYELGNAVQNDVSAPEPEIAPQEKIEDAMPEEMLKMQSKIAMTEKNAIELSKRNSELMEANKLLQEVVTKAGIERSAKLRAGRAQRLSDIRMEIGLEDKDTINDLMKMESKAFLEKEAETMKVAARLKSSKNNAFVKEAGKLWGKGAFGLSHMAEDNKEPSLIKNSKLDVSWSRAIKDKKEEED